MPRLLSLLLFLGCALRAIAQTSAPIDLPRPYDLHLLGPREAIHASEQPFATDEKNPTPTANTAPTPGLLRRDTKSPAQIYSENLSRGEAGRIYDNFQAVHLDVIVNLDGHVESAHAVSGPKQFFAQAEAIEARRVFQPIRVNGQIVRAHFDDYVSIYPMEHYTAVPTPFPAQYDLASVTIGLQRTRCFGSCPAYTVTLSGNGDVTFLSDDRSLAVPGRHTAHIPTQAVQALLTQFKQANFLSAEDVYRCSWTDLPTYTLTLSIADLHKQVVDYGGQLVGLPSSIAALEDAIDATAGTDRWIRGNALTGPSLLAEHWNFASTDAANLALFSSAVQHHNADLLHLFLAAHAPITTTDPRLRSPACIASEDGDLALVQQMLSTVPLNTQLDPAPLSECLTAAAHSGNLAILNLWISRGARPLPTSEPQPVYQTPGFLKLRSPLLNAVESGNPDVLARLLTFHPDLSPSANNGIDPLLDAMQHPSRKDPAILTRMITLLLASGDDPTYKTAHGTTALDAAQAIPCTACFNLLRQAIATHEAPPTQ